MRSVFADTRYWIALLNPRDRLHSAARGASIGLGTALLVTSEMVLVEFMNSFSGHGERLRKVAADTVSVLQGNPKVEIVPQTDSLFAAAVGLYAATLDKSWSVTDCSSFLLMRERGITEALTEDRHFMQAGFTPLLSRQTTIDRR